MTIIPDTEMVYTNLRELWTCVRREFIMQASKIFNSLHKAIKNIFSKPYKFKISLKHKQSLQSLNEFINKQ